MGLPFNIASYGLLLEMLARVTGRGSRELVISFGDLHIYDDHQSAVAELLTREPRPNPIIALSDVETIFDFKWSDVLLDGYDPHPKITAPVSV